MAPHTVVLAHTISKQSIRIEYLFCKCKVTPLSRVSPVEGNVYHHNRQTAAGWQNRPDFAVERCQSCAAEKLFGSFISAAICWRVVFWFPSCGAMPRLSEDETFGGGGKKKKNQKNSSNRRGGYRTWPSRLVRNRQKRATPSERCILCCSSCVACSTFD